MKKILFFVFITFISNIASAGIPRLNMKCGGGIEVHASQGGPVYINGKEANLKKINNNYFEAHHDGKTVSIAINPDGTPNVSFTGKHGENGMCQPADFSSGNDSYESRHNNSREHAMPPAEMPKYCKGMAAGEFNTKPDYIHIDGPATMTADAGFVVTGKVDLGSDGKKHFSCKFDNFGKFKNVKTH